MTLTLEQLLTAIAGGAILVPFIQGIVGMIKTVLPDSFPGKYWPSISVLVGIGLSLLFAYVTGGWWVLAAIVGAVAGLAAAQLYSYGKGQTELPPRG